MKHFKILTASFLIACLPLFKCLGQVKDTRVYFSESLFKNKPVLSFYVFDSDSFLIINEEKPTSYKLKQTYYVTQGGYDEVGYQPVLPNGKLVSDIIIRHSFTNKDHLDLVKPTNTLDIYLGKDEKLLTSQKLKSYFNFQ